MTTHVQNILAEAQRLSDHERAEVAAALIATLDGEVDADVEQAWAREVARRAQNAVDGKTSGRDWPQVHNRIKDELGRS